MERIWPRLSAPALASRRLDLEPLRVEHAAEAALAFDDVQLHTYLGSAPATVDELRSRFRRQCVGRSPDGTQDWLNWMVRDRASDALAGTVQATVHHNGGHHNGGHHNGGHHNGGHHDGQHHNGGPHDGSRLLAEVAWVVVTPFQAKGVATEAATVMIDWLRRSGVDVIVAHIHPDNQPSNAVAGKLGLHQGQVMPDGEALWTSAPNPQQP
jgi:RimJ/RimL family protein N-acetyltransferase